MEGSVALRPKGKISAETPKCAIRDVLDRVGDSWSVLVVLRLGEAPRRFNELRRQVGGISQRMLTVTLRHLERDGLVARKVIPHTPPQVEYRLTELGRSLLGAIEILSKWATDHQPQIQIARAAYDGRGEAEAAE
ncbi:MAG TPA: helix-turn-helix domain-containing protein [Magnetospirillaceae bacterium]|jgi:DNA-binding HxlR family transcriptional regulator